jgi:hypothetical protein
LGESDEVLSSFVWARGLLIHAKSIRHGDEADKAQKHEIKLLEAREDSAIVLESAEQSLDFVAPLVQLAVVFPWFDARLHWHHHWH